MLMNLRVYRPGRILVEDSVTKLVAEAENGSFCLLPRHIDFVAALAPGLLFYVRESGDEEFLAVAEGILVKKGLDVFVSTVDAVRGPDLGQLKHTVRERCEMLDERERLARSALARLEADFVRRFTELREW